MKNAALHDRENRVSVYLTLVFFFYLVGVAAVQFSFVRLNVPLRGWPRLFFFLIPLLGMLLFSGHVCGLPMILLCCLFSGCLVGQIAERVLSAPFEAASVLRCLLPTALYVPGCFMASVHALRASRLVYLCFVKQERRVAEDFAREQYILASLCLACALAAYLLIFRM